MGTQWIRAALAGAVSLTATSAVAAINTQEVPRPSATPNATPVAPLTVESARPEELKRQTYSFVQAFAATTAKLDQVARWTQPVCVSAVGLSPDLNAQVKARVEDVAKALGVGAQGVGCRSNVEVFFTDKPQALLDRVAGQHEQLLGYWHRRDRNKLKTVTHPIQSWYMTATGGAGGNTVGMTFETVEVGTPASGSPAPAPRDEGGRQPHGFQIDDEDNQRAPTGCGDNPHFTACLTSEFQHVMVVVDFSKVQGLALGPIADFVTMLALAQPKSLDGCNALPSVVDLFSQTCAGNAMNGLTRADVAYLTALYKTNLEARKAGQQTDIADKMADMLLKADASDRLAAFGGAAAKPSAGK
jgi:hypothetical protein